MQIGPTFVLSVYMLFAGHIRAQDADDVQRSTWKEAVHKAVVRLMRVPLGSLYELAGATKCAQGKSSPRGPDNDSMDVPAVKPDEFAYQLVIVEDLDDDRVHSFEDDEPQPQPYGDINVAGIREVVPIHEISKIFYADTGKILNIGSEGEANNPVLLLKRDPHAIPPRRMMDASNDIEYVDEPDDGADPAGFENRRSSSSQAFTASPPTRSFSIASDNSQRQISNLKDPWRLPSSLDPEWIAFEVYKEADDSDAEAEDESTVSTRPSRAPITPLSSTTSALSHLQINTSTSTPASEHHSPEVHYPNSPSLPPIRTSLSLLEMLIRLLSLQQFQQTPHLSIPDELLTFFLSESASTGAASNDAQERRRLREDARQRVGFDPYDESPVKRRGEEYQYNNAEVGDSPSWNARGGREFTDERYGTPFGPAHYDELQHDDEGYNTRNMSLPSRRGKLPFTPRRAATDSPFERSFRNRPSRETAGAYSGHSSKPGGDSRPTPLTRRSEGGRQGLRSSSAAGQGRMESPLAKSGGGMIDGALGTSPGVQSESERKVGQS